MQSILISSEAGCNGSGFMVWGALLGGGIVYGAYVTYNNKKEKEAKNNDPELIFHANDQQDDARLRKIKKCAILGRLVYGMYDRFRGKPEKEYQKWWTKVHYDLLPLESVLTKDELNLYAKELQDERKNKYFGVFRRNKEKPSAEAPAWVVAIRGTEPSALVDLHNDAKIVLEKLNSSNLITILHAVVRRLAGLLVCRRLALEGCLVEGHFFNPPFTTLGSMARTCANVVKHAIIEALPAEGEKLYDAAKRAGNKVLNAVADTDRSSKALAEFKKLAEANWTPYLYVNKHDFICCEFLSHFREAIHGSVDEDRNKWYSSVAEFTKNFLGETESFHLFPSAHLVTIETHRIRPISAHMLWNWIDPHVS
ncbi:hypothetical protein MARPO_0194s0013 [Marchantia polymorpha]|uniref:Uncharacterized protein n=1 Tax=Marchantia polymorpha TaxID=3197 RepID=A0A2R6W106_MARPO|nr:hypothetical protein MARPO_0194s0013 [Marchantia polymorpha]|eukprot:PTQ27535.1 hypothetical protein MARPO_0194s0013 [Marchantia polymorpha]